MAKSIYPERKIIIWCLAGMFTISSHVCALASIPARSDLLIASPDHPETWYTNGFEKLGQSFRWSNNEQGLFLDVTYGLVPYPDITDPTQYETFTLSFPSAKMDGMRRSLYVLDKTAHRIEIGRVVHGIFETKIVLNANVRLSAHRKNGSIVAILTVTNLDT